MHATAMIAVTPGMREQSFDRRLKRMWLTCAMTMLLWLSTFWVFGGNVIMVDSAGNSGTGTLRDAVNIAANGDTIRFDASLSGNTITLLSEITINKNLTIAGAGTGQTIISGNNTTRIFKILSGDTVRIESLTLTDGMAADSGGAIHNSGRLTVRFCTLLDNSATHGGAILNSGFLSLATCTLSNNSATAGSGGGVFSTGSLFIASASLFQNNTASGQGGAISVFGGNNFTTIIVTGNTASSGGGIYATTTLNLNISTVSSNTANAGHGGGVFSSGTGSKVTTCTITNNTASNAGFSGGGIYSTGSMLVTSGNISGNNSSGNAGGIYSSATISILSSSIFNNNADGNAGGIYNSGSSSIINYSTLSGNTASQSGGAIDNDGNVQIERSTIAFNEAGGNGGGIRTSDTLRFWNTIISNNTATQGPEIFNNSGTPISLGYNLVMNNAQSGFTPTTGDIVGTAALPEDAMLGPLQNNGGILPNHEPLCGSPAIDAGDSTDAPAFDQRGQPRIYGSQVDIGSVEIQVDPLVITPIITDISQPGASDGSIQVSVSGGLAPYTYVWNNGNQTDRLNNLAKGSYSVTVKDFYECEAEGIFTVGGPDTIPGMPDIGAGGFSLYPNPVSQFFTIDNPKNHDIYRIRIMDVNGKIIQDNNIAPLPGNKTIRIPVTILPPGYYICVIETGSGRFGSRFAKAE